MAKIKIGNVLYNILSIVTVIAVLFVGFNLVTGTRGYAVTSDSMADTLNIGDVVFSRKIAFEKLKKGDIITVRINEKSFFTHRIVDIDAENRTVTTKGDANAVNDPMPSKAEMISGRMVYSIPFFGYISILFNGGSNITLLVVLIILAAVLIAANTIITRKQKMRGDRDE